MPGFEDAPFEPDVPMPSKRPTKEASAPKPAATKPAEKEEAVPVPEILKADLAKKIEKDPGTALLDEATRAELYREIEQAIAEFKPDLSTGVGRKAVASFAYKITRTKTALDEAGKALNAELRKKIDSVDEVRREFRTRLDDYAGTARQPLTDWEEAEKARDETKRAVLAKIATAVATVTSRNPEDQGVEAISAMLDLVRSITIDAEIFADDTDAAQEKRDEAISTLAYALNQAQEREETERQLAEARRREEEQAAELERLRKLDEERQAREDQERIDRERRDRERREAEENAEREREAAIERARAEEQQRSQAEIEKRELAHKQELARIEEEQRQKEAQREQERQEQIRRDSDAAHKRKANTEARNAIMAAGEIEKEAANKIVSAILAGDIPHVTLTY